VIKSFADKATQKIYQREFVKKLPREIQQAGLRKLRMLNNAKSLRDLRSPPGNWLEKMKDDRAGQYSIRINDQWRVCFKWRENDAYEVEITDFHS
jgi:proteic killer suppression protein